jgi:hypothetical protein
MGQIMTAPMDTLRIRSEREVSTGTGEGWVGVEVDMFCDVVICTQFGMSPRRSFKALP